MTCRRVEEPEDIQVKKTELPSSRITYLSLYEELVILKKKKVNNSRNTPAPLLIRPTLSGNTTHFPGVCILVLELISPDWRSFGKGSWLDAHFWSHPADRTGHHASVTFAKEGNSVGTEGIQRFGSGVLICTFSCSRTNWDWHLMSTQTELPYVREQWHPISLGLSVVFSLHGSALHSESIIQPSQRLLGRRGEPGSAMGVQASGSEHQATDSEEINPQAGRLHTHTCLQPLPWLPN